MAEKNKVCHVSEKTEKAEMFKERAYSKTCYGKFSIEFNIEEQEQANTLIVGGNKTGKSRLACGIASILQNLNWRIVAFDPVGIYQRISDIPVYYTVRKARNFDEVQKVWYYAFPSESMIYDLSLIIPSLQRDFVNDCLERIWNQQVRNPTKKTLILLEECQLYMKNVRGNVSQNLLRIMSAGRNHKIRVLAIGTDLALIDPSFIRLTSQRYYGRTNIEENSRRKFRAYHGLDWTRVAQELDLGYFIYMFRDTLKIVQIPCFETSRIAKPYEETLKPIITPKPKGLFERIIGWFK